MGPLRVFDIFFTMEILKMASMKSAKQVASKWKDNFLRGQERAEQSVMALQVNPMELAAAREDYWFQRLQEAKDKGKFSQGLRRVPKSVWQQNYIKKGLPAMRTAAPIGESNMDAFMTKWLPYQQQMQAAMATMPKGGEENAVARARFAINWNMKGRGMGRKG